jgi:hypothetical protein
MVINLDFIFIKQDLIPEKNLHPWAYYKDLASPTRSNEGNLTLGLPKASSCDKI